MARALRSLLWFALVPLPAAYGIPVLLALFAKSDCGSLAIGAIGVVVAVPGTVGLIWCFVEFVRGGQGTPAPYEPPRQLVTRGLYRYSRNPMYVCALMVVLGQGLWWESWLILGYAGILWMGLHAWIVLHEEPILRRRFGREYERYTATVPRWVGIQWAGR